MGVLTHNCPAVTCDEFTRISSGLIVLCILGVVFPDIGTSINPFVCLNLVRVHLEVSPEFAGYVVTKGYFKRTSLGYQTIGIYDGNVAQGEQRTKSNDREVRKNRKVSAYLTSTDLTLLVATYFSDYL